MAVYRQPEAFERMLNDILIQYNTEKETMDRLKEQGKEKSATYKQFMGNRLVFSRMIALYKQYGLID